jgi:hypothetical protein
VRNLSKPAWRRGGDLSETLVLSGFVDLLLDFYDSMTRPTGYTGCVSGSCQICIHLTITWILLCGALGHLVIGDFGCTRNYIIQLSTVDPSA